MKSFQSEVWKDNWKASILTNKIMCIYGKTTLES